jgi:hypothetical protein
MIDLGSAYTIAVSVYDGTGNAANADTFTLTITLPDGTTVTPDVTNPPAITGQYAYAYTTVQSGRHAWRAVADSPAWAQTGAFDVGDAANPSILSLADAKIRLGIDLADTTDDDELRAKLAGLTGALERAKNEVIARRSITQEWMHARCDPLRLWKVPVISLDSLAYQLRGDAPVTLDVADWKAGADSGLLYRMGGAQPHGWVTAVSTAGYTIIPGNYLEAAAVLLEHLWETRRGAGTLGAGVIGPEEASDWKQMTMLPRKVIEWIGPPRPIAG